MFIIINRYSYEPTYLSIYITIYLSCIYLSVYHQLSISLSFYIYLSSIYLSICLSIQSIHQASIYPSFILCFVFHFIHQHLSIFTDRSSFRRCSLHYDYISLFHYVFHFKLYYFLKSCVHFICLMLQLPF